jgi:two-component system CheB/CheR fusion protein
VLSQAIQRLLPPHVPAVHSEAAPAGPGRAVIFVVDDNTQVRQAIRSVLEADGLQVEDFSSCEAFLAAYKPGGEACLVVDAYLPGMSGLELLRLLQTRGDALPSIMITGHSDVTIAVDAMKAGAADFIEKPISRDALVNSVERALDLSRDSGKLAAWHAEAQGHINGLTAREREIMTMVLAGHPSKNIAADLGISQRTVENHRAAIMKKTGASSLPALARLALAAESG